MSRKMRRVIIAVVAVFLIATAIIVPIEKSKNSEAVRLEAYQQAVSLLKAQEYWDAYDAFYYIKGYRVEDSFYDICDKYRIEFSFVLSTDYGISEIDLPSKF